MRSGRAPRMSLTVGWPQSSGFTSIKLCVSSETLHMRLCEAFCHSDCPGLAHNTYLVTGFPENLSENWLHMVAKLTIGGEVLSVVC